MYFVDWIVSLAGHLIALGASVAAFMLLFELVQ